MLRHLWSRCLSAQRLEALAPARKLPAGIRAQQSVEEAYQTRLSSTAAGHDQHSHLTPVSLLLNPQEWSISTAPAG